LPLAGEILSETELENGGPAIFWVGLVLGVFRRKCSL